MALVIIMGTDSNTEEHARTAVREIMRQTANPYAPQLPEMGDVYMRHYCQNDHHFWAPMTYHNGLCSVCMDVPEIRQKWGYDETTNVTINVDEALIQKASGAAAQDMNW